MKKCLLLFIFLASVHVSAIEKISSSFEFKSKNFSHLLSEVVGLDQKLLKMHLKLYEGYVINTNKLLKQIEDLKLSNQEGSLNFGALKRRLGWEYDGMRLHELYFENMGKVKPLDNKGALYKRIVRDFKSYEAFEKDFISTGLMRGIGWVILYEDPIEKRLYNCWINEHDLGHLAGGKPLLVMDVWEHAYLTEFGLDRMGYIKTFIKNISWEVVSERFKSRNLL